MSDASEKIHESADEPLFEEVNLFDSALMQGGHNVSTPPAAEDDQSLPGEGVSA